MRDMDQCDACESINDNDDWHCQACQKNSRNRKKRAAVQEEESAGNDERN